MRTYSEKRLKTLQKIGFKHEIEKLRKDYSNSTRFKQIKHNERSKSMKKIGGLNISENTGKFLDPTKIISVSAHKWAIFQYFTMKYIRGYRAHDPHDLSIFSKLLVFCTINTLINKHKLDPTRFQTIVTSSVLKFYKSTQVKVDDIITLDHLIYLMMMDDGEEYELIAAINIGAYLQKKRKKEYYSVYDADEKMYKTHMAQFYELVNSYCQTMKLENIKYLESDPLRKKQFNKCTPYDVILLAVQCLKIPLFQEIMKLPKKNIQVKFINNNGMLEVRNIQLINKTINNSFINYFNVCRNWGQNQFMNSDACVYYEPPNMQPIILIVLGSYGPTDREKDIQQIIQWYLKFYAKKDEVKNGQAKSLDKKVAKTQASEDPDPQKLKNSFLIDKRTHIRLKTQAGKELETILQEKLKGKDKPNFKIKPNKTTVVRPIKVQVKN